MIADAVSDEGAAINAVSTIKPVRSSVSVFPPLRLRVILITLSAIVSRKLVPSVH